MRTGKLLSILSLAMVTCVSNANPLAQDHINVDLSNVGTIQNEIAVLQVLSEICPPMLNASQQKRFNRAYESELQRLTSANINPRELIQFLSTQQQYKNILSETRQWTLKFSNSENKEVCTELSSY